MSEAKEDIETVIARLRSMMDEGESAARRDDELGADPEPGTSGHEAADPVATDVGALEESDERSIEPVRPPLTLVVDAPRPKLHDDPSPTVAGNTVVEASAANVVQQILAKPVSPIELSLVAEQPMQNGAAAFAAAAVAVPPLELTPRMMIAPVKKAAPAAIDPVAELCMAEDWSDSFEFC